MSGEKFSNLREYLSTLALHFPDPKDPDKPYAGMNREFKDGRFWMDDKAFASVAALGVNVMKLAERDGIDLGKFKEVKMAMGYDQDPQKLSSEELGAVILGIYMQGNLSISSQGIICTAKSEFSITEKSDNSELAGYLGQQVYGDNKMLSTSAETNDPVEFRSRVLSGPPVVRPSIISKPS